MSRETRDELVKESRPERVPVAEANRNKLKVPNPDPNFHYRVVNDDPRKPNRLQIFLDAGYEFVDNDGKGMGDGGTEKSAGVSSKFSFGVGGGVKAFLMRIPKDIYLQDQAKKEENIAAIEADMKRSARQNADYGRLEVGKRLP